MTTPTPPRRRWFRFSLRTMFVVVTLFAAGMAWLTWDLRQVQHRKTAWQRLVDQVAVFVTADDLGPLDTPTCVLVRQGNREYKVGPIRKLMGDQETRTIYYMDSMPTNDELEALRAFPEATIYGFNFR